MKGRWPDGLRNDGVWSCRPPVELLQVLHPGEEGLQIGIVTDEDQGRSLLVTLLEQQPDEGGPVVGVQGRGGLVGYHQRRGAYQGAGGGNPLLLADAEGVDGAMECLIRQLQFCQQAARLLLGAPCQAAAWRVKR